jgi:hypothetical protein
MTEDVAFAEDRRLQRELRRNPKGIPAALVLLLAVTGAALLGQRLFLLLGGDRPALQMWSTVFVAIVLQALPFLSLGVLPWGSSRRSSPT